MGAFFVLPVMAVPTLTACDQLTGALFTRQTARTYYAAVVVTGANGPKLLYSTTASTWCGTEALASKALAKALREDPSARLALVGSPAPAPAASAAPELPAFVTRKQQQQPQQAPAPLVAPGPLARTVAPLGLPARAASLLARFGLTLDGLLTAADSNPKIGKGAAEAAGVILHHLPARSLRAAIYGSSASTAPRRKLSGLQELARINGIEALAKGHNGCPWASEGCADGCLNWSGHGGISAMVANCRARRTMASICDPEAYAVAVLWAIGRAYRKARSQGLPLAYRLRGTDDSPWHWQRFSISPQEALIFARRFGLPLVPGNGITIPEALQLAEPGTLRPYEYSKAPIHGPLGLLAQRAAGIDTTASLAADRPGGLLQPWQQLPQGSV